VIVHTAPQGSELWFKARAGVLTASMFKTARTKLKNGDWSSVARDYAVKTAVERISGFPMDEGFETWAMRRGRELEPEARDQLSHHIGMDIEECGFVTTDCARFGASADGLIGDTQGVEIKCVVSPERIRSALLDNDVSAYLDQIQGGMWITGRNVWHLAIYAPILSGVNKALTVWSVARDEDYIAALVDDLNRFETLVAEYQTRLEQPIAA
jgi:hypothetical protein